MPLYSTYVIWCLLAGYEIVHYLLVARWTVAVVDMYWHDQVVYQPLATQHEDMGEEELVDEEGVESLLLETLPMKSWNIII